jgi:hypothetical protein
LVGSSPRLFAASHVLHRLLVPRHPPCALINLTTKMLASTVQFSSYGRSRHRVTAYPQSEWFRGATVLACPEEPAQPVLQDPTACQGITTCICFPLHTEAWLYLRAQTLCPTSQCSTLEQPPRDIRSSCGSARQSRVTAVKVLLRKEVIQPHLPVRLPCYDFVPIADPTFDGSLPYGLGHRLRVLPTFVT